MGSCPAWGHLPDEGRAVNEPPHLAQTPGCVAGRQSGVYAQVYETFFPLETDPGDKIIFASLSLFACSRRKVALREPCPRLLEPPALVFSCCFTSKLHTGGAGSLPCFFLLLDRERRYRSIPCRKHKWRVYFIEVEVDTMIKKVPRAISLTH